MTYQFLPYNARDIEAHFQEALNRAWKKNGAPPFSVDYLLAAQPYRNLMLFFWTGELQKLAREQKKEGIAHPYVWLTNEEKQTLRNLLSEPDVDALWAAAAKILVPQADRAFLVQLQTSHDADIKLTAPNSHLSEVDNPALLRKIEETLSIDPMGEELLAVGKENDVHLRLQYEEGNASSTPSISKVFLDDNDICIVNASEETVGDCATRVAFALRQHSQARKFGPFFGEHNTDADILVWTRLLKADAYAVRFSIAFVLDRRGVNLTPNATQQYFDGVCFHHGWLDQERSSEALERAMSSIFLVGAVPGWLDRYEQTCLPQIHALNERGNFSEEIRQSPFSHADFLCELTKIWNTPYLHREDMMTIMKELPRIGRSKYADPVRHIQPIPFFLDSRAG